MGKSTFWRKASVSLSERTMSGEPSSHHIFLYALAEAFGRVLRIIPLTKIARNHFGKSMTRPSIKNSPKYFFTSLGSGESGEPKLTSKMPLLITVKFTHEDTDIIYFFGVVPYFFLNAEIK